MAPPPPPPTDRADATRARRETIRTALVASAAGVIVVAALAAAAYREELRYRETLLRGEGDHVVSLEQAFLSWELRAVRSDLHFLAGQAPLARAVGGDVAALRALGEEYRGFARSKPFYDQIRLLDETGREIVRVNRDGGSVEIVAEADLQSKADRYYFQEAMRLAVGEIFVSPLDLNVERGEVELPLTPVIRLATPVSDTGGRRRGLLVLNYQGARLLERLRDIAGTAPGDTLLLNTRGDYLLAESADREWGWLLGHAARFPEDHPEAWEQIRESPRAQVRIDGDLFTAERVPLAREPGESDLMIVSRIPLHEAGALPAPGPLLVVVGALLAIPALAVAWARATLSRREQERRIAESESRLRALSSRLLAAQEEERRSLSRRLHDELGQQVTAIALDLKAELRRSRERGEERPLLQRVVAETDAVLADLHEMATRVRPSVLDDLGLADAIESYLSEYTGRTGVRVDAEVDLRGGAISDATAENVYRILQEALANVSTHAATDAARVELVATADGLELVVEDQGVGMDAATAARSSRLGLLGMRERVELLGGRFELDTAPGRGTRIRVHLPAGKG